MSYKIALVVSSYNEQITKIMEESATARLKELNVKINVFKVPGAVELPIITKKLALKNKFEAVVVLGAVIRGDTDHYDYVCQQVSYGCQKIALETLITIIFGVLTCENELQALDRLGGKEGNKAIEAVDSAVKMIDLLRSLDEL